MEKEYYVFFMAWVITFTFLLFPSEILSHPYTESTSHQDDITLRLRTNALDNKILLNADNIFNAIIIRKLFF